MGTRASERLLPGADMARVRQITHGPMHHWFAYYDKRQIDPTGRYALGMQIDWENRTPTGVEPITIGMVDLHDSDRWLELGRSTAWGWQQGCMLQWLPGSKEQIIWNDRGEDDYICHMLNVRTGEKRTLPHAIYCLSPDGQTAFATDFRRINDMRPGYGYPGLADPHALDLAPRASGIWRVDLRSGRREMIVSIADVATLPYPDEPSWFPPGDRRQAKHYFNHLLVNPDGTRLVFLHRWWVQRNRRYTRMFSCRPDGSDLRPVIDTGMTSHFIWRDPKHLLAYTRHPTAGMRFCIIEDRAGGTIEIIDSPLLPVDGHCTYLPGNAWILTDTYPQGSERLQEVYLFHIATERRVSLGQFHLPPQYTGEWRVDTHPRHTPDGKAVIIDSAHTGEGRQMFLIDIHDIVA